ncbi:hypothetical protein [Acinetobacter rudis]|uniref:Permease n=1 Tax=Acinetobacter rudis CIP 110305 TaxID=421052 RepID=S3NJV3_9GAMM|nr:hypothetical protein [Acinetobacter rudis]EPF80365.1 hypothetical protein F945_00503 [Acinetobacter rudis CIP 110305]
MLFPLFSFLCGMALASVKGHAQLKTVLSTLLAKILIPFVIIYNMVFYQEGHLALIALSILAAVSLYALYVLLFKDRLQALCCSYTNIGWLGLPIAMSIFGSEVSGAMIALYIGGSLFGNIWATSAVSQTAQPPLVMIKGLLRSPPVIALCIAAILRVLGVDHMAHHAHMDWAYLVSKWGMSFAGMCVLGMWLRHTRVNVTDLILSSKIALFKLLCGALFCLVVYLFIENDAIHQSIAVIFLLFCLPPAANIVALETHYQGTGTSAKYIAAGTIVSCVVIVLYAALWYLFASRV